MVPCLQQLLRVVKPVAALQIVKERRAVAATEWEGVQSIVMGENGKKNTAGGERKCRHALCLAAVDCV